MSARRKKSIFSQGSESYNYRFGSAKQRKRYRVRSRRRFVLAIAVVFLLVLLIVFLFAKGILGRDEASEPSPTQANPGTTEVSSDLGAGGNASMGARLIAATMEAQQEEKPDATEWNLVLVNEWNDLPEDLQVTTAEVLGGYLLDERITEDFATMVSTCQENGIWPVVVGGYRYPGETEVYGMSDEHATGLAVDIMDGASGMTYTEDQGETDVQVWLREHSWEYGFVLRYPADKTEITGVVYEPWHYRYVGKEAAQEMHERDLCLEEYLQETDHPSVEPASAL